MLVQITTVSKLRQRAGKAGSLYTIFSCNCIDVIIQEAVYKRQCVALDLGPGKNEGPGNFSTGETAMIYDELARSPFIANGGPLLILLIILVWFLAKEPAQKLWEWLKRLLSPPDR